MSNINFEIKLTKSYVEHALRLRIWFCHRAIMRAASSHLQSKEKEILEQKKFFEDKYENVPQYPQNYFKYGNYYRIYYIIDHDESICYLYDVVFSPEFNLPIKSYSSINTEAPSSPSSHSENDSIDSPVSEKKCKSITYSSVCEYYASDVENYAKFNDFICDYKNVNIKFSEHAIFSRSPSFYQTNNYIYKLIALRSHASVSEISLYMKYNIFGELLGSTQNDYHINKHACNNIRYRSSVGGGATHIELDKLLDTDVHALHLDMLRPCASMDDSKQYMFYYDAGRLTGDIQNDGQLTEYLYDNLGRLILSTRYSARIDLSRLFDVDVHTLHLDMLRPCASMDDSKQYMFYDDAGHLAGDIQNNGQLTEYLYDNHGRLILRTRYSARIDLSRLFDVDVHTLHLDMLRPCASMDDSKQYMFYDDAGHLAGDIQNDGQLTEYLYDNHGRLILRTRYSARIDLSRLFDVDVHTLHLDMLRPCASMDDSKQYIFYDDAGHLAGDIQNDGQPTKYLYDNQRRLILRTRYSARIDLSRLFDADVRTLHLDMLRPGASNDSKQYMFYDDAGHLTGDIQNDGQLTEYLYDNLGRLILSTRYSARIDLSRLFDVDVHTLHLDMLRPCASMDNSKRYMFYDDAGHLAGDIQNNGQLTEYLYHNHGRLILGTRYSARIELSGLFDADVHTLHWVMLRPGASMDDSKQYIFCDDVGRLTGDIKNNDQLTKCLYGLYDKLVRLHSIVSVDDNINAHKNDKVIKNKESGRHINAFYKRLSRRNSYLRSISFINQTTFARANSFRSVRNYPRESKAFCYLWQHHTYDVNSDLYKEKGSQELLVAREYLGNIKPSQITKSEIFLAVDEMINLSRSFAYSQCTSNRIPYNLDRSYVIQKTVEYGYMKYCKHFRNLYPANRNRYFMKVTHVQSDASKLFIGVLREAGNITSCKYGIMARRMKMFARKKNHHIVDVNVTGELVIEHSKYTIAHNTYSTKNIHDGEKYIIF